MAVALVALAGPGAAVGGQSDFWFSDELAPYRAFVDTYRGGDADDAVDRVREVDTDVVDALIDRVRDPDRRSTGTDAEPALNELLFRAAAMLHVDAADALWSRGLEADATDQIELGVRWIELTARRPEPAGSYRRRWYQAVALLAFERGGWSAGVSFVDVALERVTDDVALLTTAAWLNEGLALSPVILDDTGEAQLEGIRQRKESTLLAAARRAGVAVALSEEAVEAALRLARLRILLDRGDSVRGRLEALAGRDELPPEHAYVTRLLLSRVYREAAEPGESERVLREAMALLPDGQAARIALARLLDSQGARRQAAVVLQPFLRASPNRGLPDPWVDYRLGTGMGPDLRAELRMELRP